MTKTFFTSDSHFGHRNIIQYANRPFLSINEMDDFLIHNWNVIVRPNDIVYHLGDFTLGNLNKAKYYFSQLNGEIRILSNTWHHDSRWLIPAMKNTFYNSNREWFLDLFSKSGHRVEILPPMVVLNFTKYSLDGKHPLYIVLSHYPLAIWDCKHYGSIHLFGHSHGKYKPNDVRAMDVGVDAMGGTYAPINLTIIIKNMLKIKVNEFENS